MSDSFIRQRKSNTVSIDIKESDGTILKTVTFNPGDVRSQKIFAEITRKAVVVDKMMKETENMEAVEETGLFDGATIKNADLVIHLVDALENVFADLDKVFGAGTTDLVTQGVIDAESIEDLKGFLDVVQPYFKKSVEEQGEKMSKYTGNGA
jgi:hypothetical protein